MVSGTKTLPQVQGRMIVLFGTPSNKFVLNVGTFLLYHTQSLSRRQSTYLSLYISVAPAWSFSFLS
jgi:hypothetical protein